MKDMSSSRVDLRNKVLELFEQVRVHLDERMDKLMASGCGILEDHAKEDSDSYLIPKAFLASFLKDESFNYRPLSQEGRKLQYNYEKF